VNESADAVLAEASSPLARKNFAKRAIARRFMQLTYVELEAESNKHDSRRFQRRGSRLSVYGFQFSVLACPRRVTATNREPKTDN
jgi:hypothetical protein